MSKVERILIGGGVRSGKSAFALETARRLGSRRLYVATAEAGDIEMSERIARHRAERGAEFQTAEAPVEVADVLQAETAADVVVLDCLTLWLSNLLLQDWPNDVRPQDRILDEIDRLLDVVSTKSYHLIVVTNEVGMGVVPESPLGRAFRDVSGRAHARLASASDEVYFGVLGVMLRIKPEPVVAMPRLGATP